MTSDDDPQFIVESGIAKGVDALVKFKSKKLYIWAVYSLGFINRNDGNRTYHPHFDRRHNVNFVFTYAFGKEKDWEFNARWNFGSGLPFTQRKGYFHNIDFVEI